MKIGNNQVVKLRNGVFGAVASFNNEPFQLIFVAYTSPLKKYDENLKTKNEKYDIVEIYDGSKVENVSDIFKHTFTADGLELLWKRENL